MNAGRTVRYCIASVPERNRFLRSGHEYACEACGALVTIDALWFVYNPRAHVSAIVCTDCEPAYTTYCALATNGDDT